MTKRTKIVTTLGPASEKQETIERMINAGVNVFRLNFSHGTHEYHSMVLNNIRQASKVTGKIVAVLQDVCGPKIRVGKLEEDFELNRGDKIEFMREDFVGKKIEDGLYRLSINQHYILEKVNIGESIYLYDGTVQTKIVDINDEKVVVEVLNHGRLASNKGVNFPTTKLNIEALTEKDQKDIKWGVDNGVDFIGISFVQRKEDVIAARNIIKSYGGEQQIISKVEKFDAVENIDDIIEYSDGIMVARGDLGIEMPYYQVPTLQKSIIKKANEECKPVIVATQMLLSMTQNERATRAEISDVANAVLDGTDAVMLSEESAVGHDPVLVVETMSNTIAEIEKIYPYDKFDQFEHFDQMDLIDEAAARLANDLKVAGILTLTASGMSIKKLARYRPVNHVYAIMNNEMVARQLCVVWGINPAFNIENKNLDEVMSDVIKRGVEKGIINFDNVYVLTAGDPIGVPGTTNMIRILRKPELEYFYNFK